jgi:multidrug efflux pump subunit AcrA (membrane-fusion protein)
VNDEILGPEELQEMHERAEESQRNPSLLPVSFTMAVLAVLVALVTLLAHRSHTHEVVSQIKATDTWSEYQAVNTRRHSYETFADFMETLPSRDAAQTDRQRERFKQQAAQYDKRRQQLRTQAEELEAEVSHEARRADRFDFGEALLEVALVITSITLLTRRRLFWYLGTAVAVLGLVVAASGFLVR